MMKHGKYYTCKRMRLLEYLLRNGFEPESTIHDPNNIKFKWGLFRNSNEVEEAIDEYFARFKSA